MPKLNKKKTVIWGKNKDVATMQELKAKESGAGQAVFFQNPDFVHEDNYPLENHVLDAGKVIIIGDEDVHSFARVAEMHAEQAPSKPEIKFVKSPAMEAAAKKQAHRSGNAQAQGPAKPTAAWNKDKIQAWLTLNDVEFGANDTKEELLEKVE